MILLRDDIGICDHIQGDMTKLVDKEKSDTCSISTQPLEVSRACN